MAKLSAKDKLVNHAIQAMNDEVRRWRRVPWLPGCTRLIRGELLEEMIMSGPDVAPPEEATITYHDVPDALADDIVMQFAMEKVVETILARVTVEKAGDDEG